LNFNEPKIEPLVTRVEPEFAVHCRPTGGLHLNRIASNYGVVVS
jgi:hypothetical protein